MSDWSDIVEFLPRFKESPFSQQKKWRRLQFWSRDFNLLLPSCGSQGSFRHNLFCIVKLFPCTISCNPQFNFAWKDAKAFLNHILAFIKRACIMDFHRGLVRVLFSVSWLTIKLEVEIVLLELIKNRKPFRSDGIFRLADFCRILKYHYGVTFFSFTLRYDYRQADLCFDDTTANNDSSHWL